MRAVWVVGIVILAASAGAKVGDSLTDLSKRHGSFNMSLLSDGMRLIQFEYEKNGRSRLCVVSSNFVCLVEMIHSRTVVPQSVIDSEMLQLYPEWHIEPVKAGSVTWMGASWSGIHQAFVATNQSALLLIHSDHTGPRLLEFYSPAGASSVTARVHSSGGSLQP